MTEQMPNPKPVVVAVGYEPADAALAYGATEAMRAGCGLHVVHAVHVVATGPEMPLVDATDIERIGRQALRGALEHARSLVPADTVVTGEVVHGSPVPAIVSAASAADARAVVLQRRVLSRIMRVVTRSVSSGVAARSKLPVVSVPSSWTGAEDRANAPVTVGVEDPRRAHPVLAAALDAAGSRGAVLRVVHTWWYPAVYDDIVARRTEDDKWAERAQSEIQAVIDGLDGTGVEIQIDARHAWPADALVAASHDSSLLVVGRHDPLVPFGSHLGPVARAVLHEAACPVELVNPGRLEDLSA